MPIDTRIRITQMLIKNSFLELLKTTRLSKITVTKICENAQIHRVTFYKHYLDTFDLYDKMVMELINDVVAQMMQRFNRGNLKEAIRAVFQDIYDNSTRYTLFFSENVENCYRLKSVQMCLDKFSELDIKIPYITEEEHSSLKTFLSCSGGGVLSAWVQGGMKQDPIEAADRLYDFMERIIKSYDVTI